MIVCKILVSHSASCMIKRLFSVVFIVTYIMCRCSPLPKHKNNLLGFENNV